MKCDIAIIGAGAAGIAAAVAAAESDLNVVVIERYGFVGGLATSAMVGTICGLYHRNKNQARYAVQGFAREFSEQVMTHSNTQPAMYAEGLHFLPYQPQIFHQQAVQILQQAGVKLLVHMYVTGVKVHHGLIAKLRIQAADSVYDLYPKAVVDCSGNAQVSMLTGLELDTEQHYQTGAFIFQVSGLPEMQQHLLALHLLRSIKRGVNCGDLDPYCDRLSIVPGTVNQGSGLIKLGLPNSFNAALTCLTDYELQARTRSLTIIDYLRRTDTLLKGLTITAMATQVGIRSGPRPRGIDILQAEQLLDCTKPDDGVAIGAWPIEYWGEQHKPEMQYFASDDFYLIPAGALVSRDLKNLFFAGRALSATESAIASARVIGTCLNTGFAAGMLAAGYLQEGVWQAAIKKIRLKQVFAA